MTWNLSELVYGIKKRGLIRDSFSLSFCFREKNRLYYENDIIGGIYMITLSVLTIILLSAVIIATTIAVMCGAGFIFVFGDIIIAALIVALLVKLFKKNKKK